MRTFVFFILMSAFSSLAFAESYTLEDIQNYGQQEADPPKVLDLPKEDAYLSIGYIVDNSSNATLTIIPRLICMNKKETEDNNVGEGSIEIIGLGTYTPAPDNSKDEYEVLFSGKEFSVAGFSKVSTALSFTEEQYRKFGEDCDVAVEPDVVEKTRGLNRQGYVLPFGTQNTNTVLWSVSLADKKAVRILQNPLQGIPGN